MESNVDVLRAIFRRFNETGRIDFTDHVHPDIELHDRPDVPDRKVWRGAEGVLGFLSKTAELFDPIHWEPQEMTPEGRHVIVRAHVTAYGATSGAPVEMDETQLWTFQDGLIIRLQGFPTVEGARAMARDLEEADGSDPAGL